MCLYHIPKYFPSRSVLSPRTERLRLHSNVTTLTHSPRALAGGKLTPPARARASPSLPLLSFFLSWDNQVYVNNGAEAMGGLGRIATTRSLQSIASLCPLCLLCLCACLCVCLCASVRVCPCLFVSSNYRLCPSSLRKASLRRRTAIQPTNNRSLTVWVLYHYQTARALGKTSPVLWLPPARHSPSLPSRPESV